MAKEIYRDPDLEWLDHVPPVGLVVAPTLLKDLGLSPLHQTPIDTGLVAELLASVASKPTLSEPWAFMEQVLGWEARHVAGAPGGPPLPEDGLVVHLPEHGTTLLPTWAVRELGEGDRPWQLLVRIEAPGIDPDDRNALDGWEATPHQRFERLLRDTGVFAGLLISERAERVDGETKYAPEIRLIYAPRGETSGYQSFPIRPMAIVAGRPMLGGLKLLLDRYRLFSDSDDRRLPALLKRSRDAQALVSTALAEQVLGALHELLRGLDSADPPFIRELAANHPDHLYEGLLTVLMRLVFVLYAEDRDLLPSRPDARAREIYETSYSVRGLYARLTEDAALNPDTMDERRGCWGGLLALFRLIHKGHKTGFVQARGGKLFDPDEFPFLEGRATKDDRGRILTVSDGCLLRILEGLMTLKLRGAERERLSYRTLDVEQIGSVYETVMGFTVEAAKTRVLAIKAGKNNKTPVFVALDELLAKKGKERIKDLKEKVGRSLTASQARPVEAAKTVEEITAALDGIVDERGSPRHAVAPPSTPILQPTGERRRTGSHYTPRSLTGPIVKHALEPAFDRLGPDATPEQVLELKVCDPAMGSGAFLVEACRAIGERLVAAWTRWPDTRPTIPADEDEELHARRLVAQRCLYGVDKNPRAVDLARLSLWLATLAKDHEFTFLDHALKSGDSLVGLTEEQIAAANWDKSKPGLPLFRQLVAERVAEALKARAEIQAAPDDTIRAIQEARYYALEGRLAPIRTMGDAVISAFFAADKPKARERKRAEVESWLTGSLQTQREKLETIASSLRQNGQSISPFHWPIEFPEVFIRANGGFDAVVGNPPFLGGSRISSEFGAAYLTYLLVSFATAGDKTDMVLYFFARSLEVLRDGGAAGLVGTNTISQGDSRSTLRVLKSKGFNIFRAISRLPWPGEATVVVSILHLLKGSDARPKFLDNNKSQTISVYLKENDIDDDPIMLSSNSGLAYEGFGPYGAGFIMQEGSAELAALQDDSSYDEIIFDYVGGDDILNNSDGKSDRKIIYTGKIERSELERLYPLAYEIIERTVRPERAKKSKRVANMPWWQFLWPRPELKRKMSGLKTVFVRPRVAKHHAFMRVPSSWIISNSANVICSESTALFACVQSRPHENWARFFSSTLEDRLRYTPSDCFRTFPFPECYESNAVLSAAGESYHVFREQLMVSRSEGLTKTYNRFHARGENSPDIAQLRAFHSEMDVAVLRAYGWSDLADRAMPQFIEQDADEGKTPKTRLDWPTEFKDEVLARLLALNAERAAAERAAGLILPPDEDEPDLDPDEDNEDEDL